MVLREQELGAPCEGDGRAGTALADLEPEGLGMNRREIVRRFVAAEGAGMGVEREARRVGLMRVVGDEHTVCGGDPTRR